MEYSRKKDERKMQMEEDGQLSNPTVREHIQHMSRLYQRNKVLLATWKPVFAEEFIENVFAVKEARSALGKMIGEDHAFAVGRDLYLALFPPVC
jgi:hypothetical protein